MQLCSSVLCKHQGVGLVPWCHAGHENDNKHATANQWLAGTQEDQSERSINLWGITNNIWTNNNKTVWLTGGSEYVHTFSHMFRLWTHISIFTGLAYNHSNRSHSWTHCLDVWPFGCHCCGKQGIILGYGASSLKMISLELLLPSMLEAFCYLVTQFFLFLF